MKRSHLIFVAALAAAACLQQPASAGSFGAPGYSPRVPVSGLGISWFDPSRLHMSTSLSMGTGFGGGSNGLQVTSLSYQVGNPLWVSVSLGNSFGANAGRNAGKFFLEGFQAAYRPSPNMVFQIQYQDRRSPLQYSPYGASPYQAAPFDGSFSR